MTTDTAAVLADAALTVRGRIAQASNHTMLVEVAGGDPGLLAIYKPQAGERPLWDFPYGTLHLREVAAYVVSDYLGWRIVPPTVLRDGPMGRGSVQLFIEHDPRHHYFVLVEDDAHDEALVRMALFDLLINNADRKAGHVLLAGDGRIWGCDHGLTFHEEPKLRTVIWEFGGTRVPAARVEDLRRLASDLEGDDSDVRGRLAPLLAADEVAMLRRRAAALAHAGALPDLDEESRPYPWPPI